MGFLRESLYHPFLGYTNALLFPPYSSRDSRVLLLVLDDTFCVTPLQLPIYVRLLAPQRRVVRRSCLWWCWAGNGGLLFFSFRLGFLWVFRSTYPPLLNLKWWTAFSPLTTYATLHTYMPSPLSSPHRPQPSPLFLYWLLSSLIKSFFSSPLTNLFLSFSCCILFVTNSRTLLYSWSFFNSLFSVTFLPCAR